MWRGFDHHAESLFTSLDFIFDEDLIRNVARTRKDETVLRRRCATPCEPAIRPVLAAIAIFEVERLQAFAQASCFGSSVFKIVRVDECEERFGHQLFDGPTENLAEGRIQTHE